MEPSQYSASTLLADISPPEAKDLEPSLRAKQAELKERSAAAEENLAKAEEDRRDDPRWSPQKRPYVVTSKPAKGKRSQDMKLFYTNTTSLGKVR
jgi:hypothetical protein